MAFGVEDRSEPRGAPDPTGRPTGPRLWSRLVQGGPSWAALLAALLALGAYAATAAPGIALTEGGADGAELAVAVGTLGIPHPTGYPTYLLLAQAARLLPGGALAGRLSLFSALAAALAVGSVALAAAELFPGKDRRFPAFVAALTAGLVLAAAGLFWSQAVIVEVYTLHALFLALAAWLLLRWRRRGGICLPLAGLALGLGLGNHVTLAFAVAGAGIFFLIHPSPPPAARGLQAGPGFFLTQVHRRPTLRELMGALGALGAGLLVYLYLPLRAAADPWLNWGDPRTWSAFWEHVGGLAYRRYLFQVPLAQALGRVSAVAGLLLRDLLPRGAILGLGGAILLGRRDRAALALLGIPAGLGLLLAVTYGGADSYVHLLPLYVAWALWAGVAAGMVAILLRTRWGARVALAALLLPLLALPLFVRGWGQWNRRQAPTPTAVWEEALAAMPPGGILLSNVDEQTFPLWYLQVVDGRRSDVVLVDVRLLEWAWYRRQLPARYPGLAVPEGDEDRLRALLVANAGRPAFSMGPVPLPAGYLLQSSGSLFRVVPPTPLPVPC